MKTLPEMIEAIFRQHYHSGLSRTNWLQTMQSNYLELLY
jgi:hypothetical protein